jgi:hypothetical protein
MPSARKAGSPLSCREDTVLTSEEKGRLNRFLEEHGLSEDIFTYFESLLSLSTEDHRFLFLKVFAGDDLVGLAMFARVQGNSLYHSLNSRLREHSFLAQLTRVLKGTLYFSMHSISSPGLPRSFLYTDKHQEDAVHGAILSWARTKKDANSVLIIDSAEASENYGGGGTSG